MKHPHRSVRCAVSWSVAWSVAATLACPAVPRPACAAPLPISRAGSRGVYLDGASPRELTRLGTRGEDGRMAVSLRHPRTGAALSATLGDEALVQLAPGASAEALLASGLVPVRELAPALRLWQVRGRAGEDGLDVVLRLGATANPLMTAAIPDLAFPHVRAGSTFSGPPNDPRYSGQWFFTLIDMNSAWARETGAASTTVVVVDDGCDLAHPDLVEQLDPGTDVYASDSDPSYDPGTPSNNHGTACAGLVGARTNNGIGVAGACPGCRLRCVRLLGADGAAIPLSADIGAFQFALDVGAAVVSNSWGYKQSVPVADMLRQMLELIYDTGRGGKGTIPVFAAGNDDRELADDEINAVRGVLTVGAVNNFGELTSYSNHGPSVDLVAPTGTLTTDISGAAGGDPGDYISSFGGTSSACPIVAGVLGLLVSAAPTRPAAALVEALLASARQSPFATPDATGHDDFYGQGELRPTDALRLVAGEVLDGGVHDQGGADAGPAGQTESGCGCSLGGGPQRGSAGLSFLALACLTVARNARRRRAA